MSKNNLIRKSDKKFIRLEKSRIRKQFLDVKKQEELITQLYKRILPQPKTEVVEKIKEEKSVPEKVEIKKEPTHNAPNQSLSKGKTEKKKRKLKKEKKPKK